MKYLAYDEIGADLRADMVSAEKAALESAYPADATTKIGCVIVDGGQRYTGANIKRFAWNATTCAEVMAIDQALFHHVHKIDRFVIYIKTNRAVRETFWPCGAVREIMSETLIGLGQDDVPVYSVGIDKTRVTMCMLSELIPGSTSMVLGKAPIDGMSSVG